MGLLGMTARTAVVAGAATYVAGNVQRLHQRRWVREGAAQPQPVRGVRRRGELVYRPAAAGAARRAAHAGHRHRPEHQARPPGQRAHPGGAATTGPTGWSASTWHVPSPGRLFGAQFWSAPATWDCTVRWLVVDRPVPSVLFAVLTRISVALLSGRTVPVDGDDHGPGPGPDLRPGGLGVRHRRCPRGARHRRRHHPRRVRRPLRPRPAVPAVAASPVAPCGRCAGGADAPG